MNPFEKYAANFDQERLNQYMQSRQQPQRGQSSGGMGFGPENAMAASGPMPPAKKKKSFLIDQISTAGGILGGIGGGLAGGAAGLGIGAVPGAMVGSAGGSAAGELLENFLTGDNLGDNVLKEGALGGLFGAGPVRLVKTALGAKAALSAAKSEGAELGLKAAVKQGSDEAMKMSLRNGVGKVLTSKSKEFATKQFGFTDDFISKFGTRHKEDPGKTITRLGIGTIDDIEKQIAKNQTGFDDLVRNANPVDKNSLRQKFAVVVDDFIGKAPTDQKKLAGQIQDEVDQMIDGIPGDKIPATMVNQIRKQYDDLVNHAMKNPASSTPYKTDVNKELAGGLREAIQEASGSDSLKKTGAELSKLYALQKEALARAPKLNSRGSSPVGLRNSIGMLTGASIGGAGGAALGGLPGMVIGAGLTAAANSAPARRAYTKGAIAGGDALTKWGAGVGARNATTRGIMQDQGLRGLARGAMTGDMSDTTDQAGASSLDDVFTQSQSDGSMNQQSMGGGLGNMMPQGTRFEDGSVAGQSSLMGGGMQGQYGQSQAQSTPYSKDALLYDMQRDPANADKYIAYFQQLDEIFSAQASGQKLTKGTIDTISGFDNSLANLDEVEGLLSSDEGSFDPIRGRLRGLNPYDRSGANINQATLIAAQNIGRALEGGKLTDADIARYQQALPNIRDTPQKAQDKINRLRSLISSQRNNYINLQSQYGNGMNSLDDLYAPQMQQQGGNY